MTYPAGSSIARELDDHWKANSSLWQQWQIAADLDMKMYTGQQDYWNNMYGFTNYRNQRMLLFNKILRIINMIGGYQRDNRLATIVQAADNDPDNGESADQMTTIINWAMNQEGTYEKISDCFDGSNVCGLNLLSVWMDFREDPENGTIRTSRLPFNSFMTDPYWQDFHNDCDWVWTRRYLTKPQLTSLFPKIEKDIPLLGKGYANKDGKFQYLPQNWFQYQQELYAYDEYWKKDYKKKKRILDNATGEIVDWHGTREQFQMLRQFNQNVELITTQVPTIRLYVLVNNHLIYEEKTPFGLDRLPFVPFNCYHFPEVQNYEYRYQGVVRNIRDSQIELNRRRNKLLDIMDAQVQSGLMVKEDALVNPEDAFFQGPGKVLYFKQSANLASDVAPIPPPPVAQGWMELIQTIEKEIMDIVGPEELFAQNMGAKEMTGVLMKLKMGAGLTGLRNIFDRCNQSQKILGEIFIDLSLHNFSSGKIKQILGKEPTEILKKITNPENQFKTQAAAFIKFNCAVEEGDLTSTQRQRKFLDAIQLKQIIPNAISDEYLLENSTLAGKKELIEMAKKNAQQQAQMQQAAQMQQLQQNEILTRSIEAKAQNDFAAAEERKARAVSDIALAKERTSQAVQDRASAALDNAKALKEIGEMDENRLMKLANFIIEMQRAQKEMQGNEEGDSIEEAKKVGLDTENTKQASEPSQIKQKKQSSLAESIF